MKSYIPETLRSLVAKRAEYRCEYCRIASIDSFFKFHIDHIISLKHGGKTDADNLAYACQVCNLNKGTDIFTFLETDTSFGVRFFNPRTDLWTDHFEVAYTGEIIGKTAISLATIKIFDLNHPDSIVERQELLKSGLF